MLQQEKHVDKIFLVSIGDGASFIAATKASVVVVSSARVCLSTVNVRSIGIDFQGYGEAVDINANDFGNRLLKPIAMEVICSNP